MIIHCLRFLGRVLVLILFVIFLALAYVLSDKARLFNQAMEKYIWPQFWD